MRLWYIFLILLLVSFITFIFTMKKKNDTEKLLYNIAEIVTYSCMSAHLMLGCNLHFILALVYVVFMASLVYILTVLKKNIGFVSTVNLVVMIVFYFIRYM